MKKIKTGLHMSFLGDPLKYRWLMFAISGILYFLVCFYRISPGVIAKDLAYDFNIDAVILGLISASYFYTYSAVQPVVGILSDTIGPRRVLTIFTIIAFAGAVLFGTSTNAVMAFAGRALIGAGVGGVFVPTLKLISRWYSGKDFTSLTGILLAIGGFGMLSAALPLAYLVRLLGWRMSFVVLGIFSLLLALICWIVVRDRPEEKGWGPIENETEQLSGTADSAENSGAIRRIGIIFKKPGFWIVTVSIFFSGGAGLSFQGLWGIPYLIDVYEYTRVEAGGIIMLMPIGFALGAPIFGLLTDKLGINRRTILLVALSISICCWLIFLLYGSKPPSFLLIPFFFIMGICGGGSLPLYMVIIKDLFPPWLTGTAVGLMNPAAFFAASLYQPFTGYLLDRVGKLASGGYPVEAYQNVFIAFIISFIISFLTIIFLEHKDSPS